MIDILFELCNWLLSWILETNALKWCRICSICQFFTTSEILVVGSNVYLDEVKWMAQSTSDLSQEILQSDFFINFKCWIYSTSFCEIFCFKSDFICIKNTKVFLTSQFSPFLKGHKWSKSHRLLYPFALVNCKWGVKWSKLI